MDLEDRKEGESSSDCDEGDEDESEAFKSIAETPQGSSKIVHASPMNLFDEAGFTQNYTEREGEYGIGGARSMTQIHQSPQHKVKLIDYISKNAKSSFQSSRS